MDFQKNQLNQIMSWRHYSDKMTKYDITFLKQKRIELLKRIDEQGNYKKSLNKLRLGLYTHQSCIKVVNIFEEAGFVTTTPVGKERHAELTKKGEKILKYLKECGGLEK